MIDVNVTPNENIIDVNLQTDDINIDLEVEVNTVEIDVNINPAIIGEKGDKGDQGEQGIQGEKGEKGDPSTPTRKQGFIDYNDTTGSIDLTADTWTTIPNNGQGAFSNSTYKPLQVSEFMNVSNGSINCTDLELGDSIIIRNDFIINPNTNNALLEFRYQLGGDGGEYTLQTNIGRLDNGSGVNYRFSLKPDLIYMGDTNTKDNPIILQVKLSTDGTLTNAGTVIQLIKSVI